MHYVHASIERAGGCRIAVGLAVQTCEDGSWKTLLLGARDRRKNMEGANGMCWKVSCRVADFAEGPRNQITRLLSSSSVAAVLPLSTVWSGWIGKFAAPGVFVFLRLSGGWWTAKRDLGKL